MSYSRERHRLPPSRRVSLRLTPEERDRCLEAPGLPRALGHLLHHAAVRGRRLTIAVNLGELEALIAAVAGLPVRTPKAGRAHGPAEGALLRYLEGVADRFAEPEDEAGAQAAG